MRDMEHRMAKIVARCSEDKAFRQRLIADPEGTLRAEGVEVPEGTTVQGAPDTGQVRMVSERPNVLSDDDLASVAAGGGEWDLGPQWKGLETILRRTVSSRDKRKRPKK